MDRRTRREYLALGGSAVVAGLAGCDSSGTTTDGGGEPTETTRSETTTKTENPEDLREMTVDEDWRYPRANLQNTGATDNTAPKGKLETRWNVKLDSNIKGTHPILADGRVFIGSSEGIGYAFDAATGRELWSTDFGHGIYHPAPVVDGSVYFHTDRVHSVDAKTGEIEWEYSIIIGNAGTPLIADSRVYCMSEGGILHVLDAETGKLQWKINVGDVKDYMAYEGEMIYLGVPDRVKALNINEKTFSWSASVSGESKSGPAIFGNNVLAEGDDIYKIDKKTGEIKSSLGISNPVSPPNASDDYITTTSTKGIQNYINVHGRNGTGWKRKTKDDFRLTLTDNLLFGGSIYGKFMVIDLDQNQVVYEANSLGSIWSFPIISSSVAFVAEGSTLRCFQEKL